MRRINAAAGIILNNLGQVLLGLRAKEPFKDTWYFPGGKQEENESPTATAQREIVEETGHTVDIVEHLGNFSDKSQGTQFDVDFYICLDDQMVRQHDPREIKEVRFFDSDDIPEVLAYHHRAVFDEKRSQIETAIKQAKNPVYQNRSRLYLVTNAFPERDLAADVEEALKQGIGILQYREKDTTKSKYQATAEALQDLCNRYNTLFIINDNVDLAAKLETDGVHIGQDDIKYNAARQKVGNKIIGVSCYSLEQALEAEQQGADYIGVHIWESAATKPSSQGAQPVGIEAFNQIAIAVKIPCVAIGGITQERIPKVLINHGDYPALVSGILKADDISATVRAMNENIRQTKNNNPQLWRRIYLANY